MKLQDLQDHLRTYIRSRIGRGELTGTALAIRAGFPQGHLSNFLNARRGLSLESMDRLLDTLQIGVLDLVNAEDIQRRALPAAGTDRAENVAVVSPEDAGLARFTPGQILETHSFNKSFLRRLKPSDVDGRRDWLRFVLLKLDSRSARSMFAIKTAGAMLLVDRHYSSLQPYRQAHPNLYAVRVSGRCIPGYVSVVGDYLILKTRDPDRQADVVRIAHGRSYSEYIVGRVCHIGLEV